MKRITVFADEDVLRKLRKIAKRESSSSVSEVTRKALVEYVSRRQAKRSRLSLVGLGRSGRDVLCGEMRWDFCFVTDIDPPISSAKRLLKDRSHEYRYLRRD